MTRFDLATAVRYRTKKRGQITFRSIKAPATFARELAALNVQVADKWKSGLPTILAEYERTLSAMQMDSPASADAQIDVLSDLTNELVLLLTPRMRLWAERVSKWHMTRWTANVLTATTVDLSTLIGINDTRDTVETVLRRNVSLVRDVSDTIRGKIADTVFRGFQKRTPPREVAKEISEAVGMQRARAIRIASHQAQVLAAELDKERMRQAGLTTYKWVASGKVNFREEHQERDGEIFQLGEPAGDGPGMAINCGCSASPVLDLATD